MTLALLTQSCVMYTDRDDDENPKEEVLEVMHKGLLNSVLHTVKLADFFDSYQEIKKDRDAAIVLGLKYYGDEFNEEELVYEGYQGYARGKIRTTPVEGQYEVTPVLHNGYNGVKYYVEVVGDRCYRIRTEPETKFDPVVYETKTEMALDCSASVTDGDEIVVTDLAMTYSETVRKGSIEVKVLSTSDSVKANMSEGESVWKMPISGTLDYEVKSNMFNDEFSVRYSAGKYDVL